MPLVVIPPPAVSERNYVTSPGTDILYAGKVRGRATCNVSAWLTMAHFAVGFSPVTGQADSTGLTFVV
ncbi:MULTISPECIES: hypothetical protein [Erwinia]|uniref:hypothetical protein n=1 Tax=Erwinia TaxID=551 RepID=UPI00105E36B4|nr:hypothetical protein [Erwinia aphidicola]MCP2231028.1 uncharacterized protein YtpQ (UPF0354 family) [Erwinia aphidicola]